MQEKMDLATKLLRHFLPRGLAALLDPLAALAEHDGALAVPCDKELLVDGGEAVAPLLLVFGLQRRIIGQLLVELELELPARDLVRKQAGGDDGPMILGEVQREWK